MRRITLLSFLIIYIFTTTINAVELNQKIIEKYQRKINRIINNKNTKPNQLYNLYLTAAEELYLIRDFSNAKKYYLKALQLKPIENKSTALLQLISIAIQTNNIEEAKERIKNANDYYQKFPDQLSDRRKNLLNYFTIKTSQKVSIEILSKKDHKIIMSSDLSIDILWHDVKYYTIAGNYNQALELVNQTNIAEVSLDKKIIADLLNYAADSKKKKNLLCHNSYKKYPKLRNRTYGLMICGIILDLQESKKILPQRLQSLTTKIKQEFPDQIYLATTLQKLIQY